MPFAEAIRNFLLETQNRKCQTMVYDEERGWHICAATDDLEVDHLTPESELKEQGRDSNKTEGIVRCQPHHTGQGLRREEGGETEIAGYGEPDWSRHPDMGQARADYRAGEKEAFQKAAKNHHDAARKGQRITNDDWSVTEAERKRVQEMSIRSGEIYPQTKPKGGKQKRWTDIFIGSRRYMEDNDHLT